MRPEATSDGGNDMTETGGRSVVASTFVTLDGHMVGSTRT